MDVLLVGADGPIGIELQRLFARWGRHRALPLSLAASRFRSERQAKKAARRGRPRALVDMRLAALLSAGIPLQECDVDRSHWLAKACERSDIRYLLLSSDRVFSGSQQRPRRESDAGDADDALGTALRETEACVRDAASSALLLRTGPIFSGADDWLLGAILGALLDKREASLDNSALFCPSAAADVARVLSAMLDQLGVGARAAGCYHYCSPDRASHYGFAEVALASAGQYVDLGDAHLHALDAGAEPRVRLLDCSGLRDTFAIKQLPWRSQINAAIKDFLRSRQDMEADNGR